jgi:hypothetical protein
MEMMKIVDAKNNSENLLIQNVDQVVGFFINN